MYSGLKLDHTGHRSDRCKSVSNPDHVFQNHKLYNTSKYITRDEIHVLCMYNISKYITRDEIHVSCI